MITTDITEILQSVGQLTQPQLVAISDWWQQNHAGITIHYISFKTPVCGGILTPNSLALNNTIRDPYLLLFLAAHESHHLDQYGLDPKSFLYGYFGTVVENDLPAFLEAYQAIEREANDYAFATLTDLGLGRIVREMGHLRDNENAGRYVYDIIRQKIGSTGAKNLFEVIRSSIL